MDVRKKVNIGSDEVIVFREIEVCHFICVGGKSVDLRDRRFPKFTDSVEEKGVKAPTGSVKSERPGRVNNIVWCPTDGTVAGDTEGFDLRGPVKRVTVVEDGVIMGAGKCVHENVVFFRKATIFKENWIREIEPGMPTSANL